MHEFALSFRKIIQFDITNTNSNNTVVFLYFFFQGTYKSTCFSSNMLRCEVGDLSGKHAMLSVGSGKEFYTDPDLPLFGEMSGRKRKA